MNNKYIQKIEIKGFQTHEDTTIELSPLFNTIIGENRAGKSAIVRALRLLFYNNPRDVKPLIRYGCDEIFVKVTMSDGSWVIRQKGEKINRYIVYIEGKHSKPMVFDNVGFSVPIEVYEATGVMPLEIGKDVIELNISSQFDPPFMISESGTNLARWLGHLSGINDVRISIDNLRKDIRVESSRQKELSDQIAILEEQTRRFEGIEDVSSVTNEVIEALKKGKEKEEILNKIISIRDQIKNRIEQIETLYQYNKTLNEALKKIQLLDTEVLSQYYYKIIQLVNIKQKIDAYQERIRLKEDIDYYCNLLTNDIRIELVSKKIDNIAKLSRMNQEIAYYVNQVNNLVNTNGEYSRKSEELQKEYEKVIKEIFSFENEFGICPLCNQKVDADVIKKSYSI